MKKVFREMDLLSLNNCNTQFNGSLDELPFDILCLIFSFVLNIPFFGERSELDTTRDKFSANRLSMVSSKFRKLVNTVCLNIIDEDRVRTAVFGCLRVDTFTDAIEMFEDNTHMLPFSLFSSLSTMIQFAICENQHASRHYIKNWIRYMQDYGETSRFFARHFLNNHVWNNQYFYSLGHLLKVADGIKITAYNRILDSIREEDLELCVEMHTLGSHSWRGASQVEQKYDLFTMNKFSVFEVMREQYKQVLTLSHYGIDLKEYFESYDSINEYTYDTCSYDIRTFRIPLTDARQIFYKYDFDVSPDDEQEIILRRQGYVSITAVIPVFPYIPSIVSSDDELSNWDNQGW